MGLADLFRSLKAAGSRTEKGVSVDLEEALPAEEPASLTDAHINGDRQLEQVEQLLKSGKFDHVLYCNQLDTPLGPEEAVLHYLEHGERAGLKASFDFDAAYYLARNEDLVHVDNLFLHYVNHGHHEGRKAHPFPGVVEGLRKLDPKRETVVLVLHETSRSGAPILGWNICTHLRRDLSYNVVVISLRGGGDLENLFRGDASFFVAPNSTELMQADQIEWMSAIIAQVAQPKYAIVNCAEAHSFGTSLKSMGVPVVALIHEFATYFSPANDFERFYSDVDAVVFSADLVRKSSAEKFPILKTRERVLIIPQGVSLVPPDGHASRLVAPGLSSAGELLRWRSVPADFNVIGIGAVGWRKGVDLFVGVAAILKAQYPNVRAQFAWVGGRLPNYEEIAGYLAEQIKRANVADTVVFLPETADLRGFYENANAFLLSSRLDPLPNVAIDAMTLGIPVVCFDEASGIAELLKTQNDLNFLVVPYLDVSSAAGVLAKLALNRELLESTKTATMKIARERFDMRSYVAKLDCLGSHAAVANKGNGELAEGITKPTRQS